MIFGKGENPSGRAGDQTGALLISLILTLIIMGILGALMVELTSISTLGELLANRWQRAYYLAESGGRYAIPQIKADPLQAETDLQGKTFTLANGDQFLLNLDNSLPDLTILQSQGIVQPGDWLESRVTITYRIPTAFAFKYAAFTGTGRLQLTNNAYIDSYDSSVAPWAGEGVMRNGYIGTNRTGRNSIRIRNQARVYGNADVGPGGNPYRDIRVDRGALLTGSSGTLTAAQDMTPKTMPSGGGAAVNLRLRNSQTYTYTTGVYRLHNFSVQDNAVLTISGNVELYVENTITFSDFGTLNILPGGSLTIYAANRFTAQNNARINQGGEAGDLVIFGTASFNQIQLSDDVVMKGAVYAPGAQAQMQGYAELFGSLITDQVTMSGNSKLHYDTALGKGVGSGGGIVQYF